MWEFPYSVAPPDKLRFSLVPEISLRQFRRLHYDPPLLILLRCISLTLAIPWASRMSVVSLEPAMVPRPQEWGECEF